MYNFFASIFVILITMCSAAAFLVLLLLMLGSMDTGSPFKSSVTNKPIEGKEKKPVAKKTYGGLVDRSLWFLLLFVVGCSVEGSYQSKPEEETEVVGTEISTSNGNSDYRIVQRTVPGGTIYEYHFKSSSPANKARGFRVVFVPQKPIDQFFGAREADSIYVDGIGLYLYEKLNKK